MEPMRPTGGGPLSKAGSAAFNAAGVAEVELGPVPPRQVWLISRMTVSATAGQPTCSVYDGSVSPVNLLDATSTGQQDISDFGQPYMLATNETLIFRWENGEPGAAATARLVGRSRVV
jgi:hypothetical protein